MIVERAAVASSAFRTSGSVRSMRRSLGARNPVPFHRQASAPPCDRATDAGPTPIAGMAHWNDPAANGRSQTDGSQLIEQHRDLGLNLEPAAKLAAQARPRSGWESLVELLLRVGLSRSSGSLPYPLVPRRSIGRYRKKRRSTMKPTKTTTPLRDRCLSHCATLGIPLEGAWLDELLSRAEKESLSLCTFSICCWGHRPTRAGNAPSRGAFGKPVLRTARPWKGSTGSSTPKPSTACRSKNWPAAISSGAAIT